MADELLNETSGVVDNTDYIEALNTLKQNSVERSKYDQLRAENKKLLDSIVNGRDVEVPGVQVEKPTAEELRTSSADELRNKLFTKDNHMSNLEYVETALALRNTLIENGEEDPFVPQGKKTICTQEDRDAAQRVADVFQQCIDVAEGNSEVFTMELMRRTRDVQITPKRNKR